MTEWGVLTVLITLVGLLGSLYKLFFQPVSELNASIRVLIQKFTNMEERDVGRDIEIKTNREFVLNHDKRITLTEKDIEELKKIKNTNYVKQYKHE